MKVEYGSSTLGDDSVGDFIFGEFFERTHTREVQAESLQRGEQKVFFPRQNVDNVIPFSVTKSHATQADAFTYFMTFPDSLADQAEFRITVNSVAYKISNACLKSVKIRQHGTATDADYEITGGKIEEAA